MTLQNASVISTHSCSSTADNNNLRWDLTPEEIRHRTQRLIQRIKQAYDSVGLVDIEKVCFENTLQVIANAKADYAGECRMIAFMLLTWSSFICVFVLSYSLFCSLFQLHVICWTSPSMSLHVKRSDWRAPRLINACLFSMWKWAWGRMCFRDL